jgi:uncharacterized membrane protein
MHKGRLEAFSDGVLAIIITIMVLELHAPHEDATVGALRPMIPDFLSYILSFIYVGIYWNNHHHLMQAANHVTGGSMWANLHLLFWLSLVPFSTGWIGQTHFAATPMAAYGVTLLMAGVAYWILAHALVQSHGHDSPLAVAIGRDVKGNVSMLLYASGIVVACRWPRVAFAIYAIVALMWLVPDPRVERVMKHRSLSAEGERERV